MKKLFSVILGAIIAVSVFGLDVKNIEPTVAETDPIWSADKTNYNTKAEDTVVQTNLQAQIDANTSTGGVNTAAIAANDTEIAALVVTTALNTVTANAALPMDGSGVMSGNLNYGGYTPTNAAGYGMTTNDTTMYSGTLGGTNGVYWSQGGTNYWILFW